ncbi:MAG TPA: hypothetical protein VNT81_09675 [Vicinamibacterales bacterium]|nr:hypothetical protein [Vicinamibacterales bacterium]
MGIPIRRIEGGQAVFAFVDELDRWLDKKQVPPTTEPEVEPSPDTPPVAVHVAHADVHVPQPVPQPLPPAAPAVADDLNPRKAMTFWTLGVLSLFACAALLALASSNALPTFGAPEPVDFAIEPRRLVATDVQGRILWTHAFSAPAKVADTRFRYELESSWWERMDADGDGIDEIVAIVGHPRNGEDGLETLYCFSLDGTLRYSYTPQFTMKFTQREFAGPWRFWDLLPVAADRGLWVALESKQWWPSVVVRIDGRGAASVRYAQPGLIRSLEVQSREGAPYLLAAGVNNAYGSASMALLDPKAEPSTAPHGSDTRYACLDCPQGKPLKYMVFPPSPLNVAEGLPYNQVISLRTDGAGIDVGVLEALGDNVSALMLYHLAHDLQVVSVTPSDAYWTWRSGSAATWKGRTGHPATSAVRSWSQGAWETAAVPVH